MLQVSTLYRAAGRIIPGHNPVGNDTDKGRKQQCQYPCGLCSVPGKAEDCGTGKAVPACVNNIKKQSHYLLCGKIINIFAKK